MSETPAEESGKTGAGLSTDGQGSDDAGDRLLERFCDLSADERPALLAERPELATAAAVTRLCDRSTAALGGDLATAARGAEAARWLAERLGADGPLARSDRVTANLLHERGEYRPAQRHYDRARRRFRRAGDDLQEAITLSSALHNLSYLGDYERAYRWYAAARSHFERLADELRLARLEMNFANVLHRQDLWADAMKLYESALEHFDAGGNSRDAAICLSNMAACHVALLNTQQALDCHLRAREIIRAHGWTRLERENDYNIAFLHYQTADYARAIRLYQDSRSRFAAAGDEHHTALCDLDLSEIFLELNLIEEAAELAGWARERFDRIGLRYEAARALTNLGVAVSRQGRIFQALEALVRARETFVAEANEVWPAQLDLYQAILLYREGRSYEAAALAREAASRFDELRLGAKAAACELLLARISLEDDDPGAAERLCRRAGDRLEGEPSPLLQFQTRLLAGMVQEATGDGEGARSTYLEAHRRAQELRGHLQTDDLKMGLFRSKLRVHEAIVSLTLQRSASSAEQRQAFEVIEQAKARSIADLMAFRAHVLPPKAATRSNLVESIRSLREELNWYHRQIDLRQMTDAGSEDELDELTRRSRSKEGQLARTLDELAAADRELSSLQQATAASLEEIQAALPEGTGLLEYFFARGAVYAALVRPRDIEMMPLTMASRVRDQHRLLQSQLSRVQLGPEFIGGLEGDVDDDTREHLGVLFEELVAPLWPRLGELEELLVIPHGFLHHLPFAALFDGRRYLIDHFRIACGPSATVAHLCRGREPATGSGALVVGVPGVDTEAEARAVATVLAGSRLDTGGELDGAGLEAAARGCRWLHLATLATVRRDNPMFSTLDLGRHRLTLFDVYSLDLDVDLVALTGACGGLDPRSDADALLGLSRGLLYAGARAVLVDLWQGTGAAGHQLLAEFYRRLPERPPAAALRAAQLAQRDRTPHPFFWAAPSLIGGG